MLSCDTTAVLARAGVLTSVVLLGVACALRAGPFPTVPAGPLLHTVSVGVGPSALAIDPRSHHVFVVNTLDASVSVLDARTGDLRHTVAVGAMPDAVVVDARMGGTPQPTTPSSSTASER